MRQLKACRRSDSKSSRNVRGGADLTQGLIKTGISMRAMLWTGIPSRFLLLVAMPGAPSSVHGS